MPDGILTDIFTPDMFSVMALSAAINQQPFLPGRIGEMKLFNEGGVPTTSVIVEKNQGALSLIAATPRGGPGATGKADKRSGISIAIPHLKQVGAVYADSVQGVRAFGQANQMKTVEAARDEELERMARNLDFTLEYHRLGAIQGRVYDSDGATVLLNCFTAFGESEPAEVDFDLDNASPVAGVVRTKCDAVTRAMSAALGAAPFTGIWAVCGDTFWDQLIAHSETRATYLNQTQASELRTGTAYQTFNYGGILFENYRGYGSVAIGATKCRFVPLGVPDLFMTRFGPADYMETVNTVGLPRYASADPMPHNRGLNLEGQSNPINICTRPSVLLRAKNT